ncbi:MAG: aldehyde dehydrogenase family protein [Myxococcales bacterium]|nr:aldehyde dehydrogenase family protein [Myxococcales bacterium]
MADFDAKAIVESLRRAFNSGKSRPAHWRKQQLKGIKALLKERENEILQALAADAGKPILESIGAELALVKTEVDVTLKNLDRWMRPERVRTPIIVQPGSSKIIREPLGVVLIIGAWNYPIQLTLAPLIGALAAGNCALVKPSEVAAHASALLAKWVPQYLDAECVKIAEGGVAETTAILEQRFDHILYTGNGTVGRIIMGAAAKHLTPVTLELGGKSPCIVDKEVDLPVAAKRIVWAKFYNAGQTCTAPDYILVHEDLEQKLLEQLKKTIRQFYGDNPKDSRDYARIINERHHARVMRLVKSGEVVVGGDFDAAERYIAPTVLTKVAPDSPVMSEEIFGPVLPVLPVRDMHEAIEFVNAREKPLALYVFTRDKAHADQILRATSSGGACVNHAVVHAANPCLPFGGVGPSGMGAYHGRAGFETFSHRKSVLSKPTRMDPPIMYPPYDETKTKWLRRLM